MTWIKAKRCYLCGRLFSPKWDGGHIITKRYSPIIIGMKKEVSICGICSYKMEDYIAKEIRNESQRNNS